MADEFQVGVSSCGGNFWNFSYDSSLVINDMAIFDRTNRNADDSSGFSPSTIPEDWNHYQDLLCSSHDGGRAEDNYSDTLQQVAAPLDFGGDSFMSDPLQQHPRRLNTISDGFPLNSSSASYNNHTSSLLGNLFGGDTDIINSDDQSVQDNINLQQPMNFPTNYHLLPYANNTGFDFLPSTKTQFLPSSLKKNKEARSLSSHLANKSSNGTSIKRARIQLQTPSPSLSPNFKVRKEKLGDRVNALQHLVSPFGKTDTASVLYEAIESIKFLQYQVLCAPYIKNRSPRLQNRQAVDRVKDQEGQIQDLKSRGLCLVPISNTFPFITDNTTDFWRPTFGDSFK